jgi:hypothetical protein
MIPSAFGGGLLLLLAVVDGVLPNFEAVPLIAALLPCLSILQDRLS